MMEMSEREMALVEYAREVDRLFYDSAYSEHQAQAVKGLRKALVSYGQPKKKVPIIPAWDDLPASDRYAFCAAKNASSMRQIYQYIRERTAKEQE